jgi:recombinational DNA repair ATPase RecF
MNNLTFQVLNYKTIKKMEVNLSNYDLAIFEGDNGTGKSSIINGILENFLAKNISNTPLTKGEIEGEKRITTKGKDGKEITIIHTFEKDKPTGTFWAMKDGKPIKSVIEIRDILGEPNNMTVDELFQMCKTIDGRRKFIRKYLYQGLTETQLNMLTEYEEMLKPNSQLILRRRDVKNKIDAYKAMNVVLTDEEQKLLQDKEALFKIAEEKRSEFREFMGIKSKFQSFYNSIKMIDVEFHEEFNKIHQEYLSKAKMFYDDILEKFAEKEKFIDERVNPKIDKLKFAIDKQEKGLEVTENFKNLETELIQIHEQINTIEAEKEKIIGKIILPEGVVIHSDGEFSINGLNFSQADISESEAWMLLAELSIKQFDAPYMRMGSASLYNKEKLNKLAELASKHNKIIALERVVDDLKEIRVIGMVVDSDKEEVIKAYFESNTGEIIPEVVNTPTKEELPVIDDIKPEIQGNDEPKTINLF